MFASSLIYNVLSNNLLSGLETVGQQKRFTLGASQKIKLRNFRFSLIFGSLMTKIGMTDRITIC